MTANFVPFDAISTRIVETVKSVEGIPDQTGPVYLIRNVYGQVRVCAPEAVKHESPRSEILDRLAARVQDELGPHGAPGEGGVLYAAPSLLGKVREAALEIHRDVYLIDRLVTGSDWWTVRALHTDPAVQRCTLFSVKGGVGRSTTATVLAWHLAALGQRVLVVDLDLESPGLSSAMLEANASPAFGITDWFVEDLVGQSEYVIGGMTSVPAWASDLEGEVRVVPAHGRDPGEYMAKLGRVYLETGETWTTRLQRLLSALEASCRPTIVILESRSGLHDIAAATVTDLNAQVLLFATDSHSTWTDYEILFRHWQRHDLASSVRERLSIVSALTPELETERYLRGFRERSWDLFRHVYDEVSPAGGYEDVFSFDLGDDGAPHRPIPVHWSRGLAAGTSLRDLRGTDFAIGAYGEFLAWFNNIIELNDVGESQ